MSHWQILDDDVEIRSSSDDVDGGGAGVKGRPVRDADLASALVDRDASLSSTNVRSRAFATRPTHLLTPVLTRPGPGARIPH